MAPLMTREMHKEFSTKRAEMEKSGAEMAHVFVPVGPIEKGNLPLRILFIGQALNGKDWGETTLASFSGSMQKANDTVIGCSPGDGKVGIFWEFVSQIVSGAYTALDVDLPKSRYNEVVGFSNLAKIGRIEGNPDKSEVHSQAAICVDQLKYEIEIMRPEVVFVMTGDKHMIKEIFRPVFGPDESFTNNVEDRNQVAFKKMSGYLVCWTNHPRSLRLEKTWNQTVEWSAKFLADYVGANSRQL